jgi:hypothetical protein
MFTRGFLILACLAVSLNQASALTEHIVIPSVITPGIDANYDDSHYAYYEPSATQRVPLLVWLPGTEARPFDYRRIVIAAANFGIHAIGLGYVNTAGVNNCFSAIDCDCFADARLEQLEGTNMSAHVIVDQVNSISNRLTQLLIYLGNNFSTEGWTNYMRAGAPVWTNIIIGGHSQGASHAGFIARRYPVYRCLMFNGADYCLAGRAANWITNGTSATPPEKFFGFYHVEDELVPSNWQAAVWTAFQLDAFGPETYVETTNPPYSASHRLLTQLTPQNSGAISHHNATAVDFYTPITNTVSRYREPWTFMMAGPTIMPDLEVETVTNGVRVQWESRTDISYQVRRTSGLGVWTNSGGAIAGTGLSVETNIAVPGTTEFFSIQMSY